MTVVEMSGFVGLATGLIVIAGWFNKKIIASADATKELVEAKLEGDEKTHASQMSSVGRTLDGLKLDIDVINVELAKHSNKISQSDIVMVHLDDTLKQFGNSIVKLDSTLRALQVAVAKIEPKG